MLLGAARNKGHAEIRLESAGANATILHNSAHASVGGKLAQIGSRLADMAARKMATECFESFTAKLQERYAVVPEAVPEATKGSIARLLAWLKRFFGR